MQPLGLEHWGHSVNHRTKWAHPQLPMDIFCCNCWSHPNYFLTFLSQRALDQNPQFTPSLTWSHIHMTPFGPFPASSWAPGENPRPSIFFFCFGRMRLPPLHAAKSQPQKNTAEPRSSHGFHGFLRQEPSYKPSTAQLKPIYHPLRRGSPWDRSLHPVHLDPPKSAKMPPPS